MCNNPKLGLVNINAYGQNPSIGCESIERKGP